MTGYASIPTVVDALKLGAYDFVDKPVDIDRLEILIEKALADRRLQDEVRALRRGSATSYAFHNLRGKSATMREVYQRVARVASSPFLVLITGETGTGKELVAQALHHNDSTPDRAARRRQLRRDPRVAAGERVLRPRARGVHRCRPASGRAGSSRPRAGRSCSTRSARSRWRCRRSSSASSRTAHSSASAASEMIQADCRIVAATNEDLGAAVAAGRFREDLFYRLNVVSIVLPPLRERIEDLPLLVAHFLQSLARRGFPEKSIGRDALARLARYDWPGNVRELEHVVEQMVVTTLGESIAAENVPPHLTNVCDEPFSLDFDPSRPLQAITDELTERIERAYLARVLERYNGRIAPTADHCGLSRRSISEKLRRYGIDKADFKPHTPRRAVMKSA